jgi:zinc carboxypeptidase
MLRILRLCLSLLALGALGVLERAAFAQTPGSQEPPAPSAAAAADPYAPDRPEPGSVEKIREYTTSPRYLPETVSYVPDSATVPSPTQVLGHLAGASDELTHVADVHRYFRRLAAASDRVRVTTIGTSEEGREILLAMISEPQNLAALDHYKEVTARLADPRATPREEARRLAAEGKVFYYLTGGLHSTETGSPEMLMELAYRLAVSERPEIRAIRDNAIVLVTPVLETDGRDRVVDWYYRHLRGKKLTFEEMNEIKSPPYWGRYAFHDDNRDGMQLTLALSRAVHETYFTYHPQVMHDLHEPLPLLYISTGHGPYSRAVDPVTVSEWTQFADHEVGALQALGLPGVWLWAFWDGWWPGYLFSVANNHNSIGRFYETFGNGSAGTFERDLEDDRFAGKPVTDVQWYRTMPPDKKVVWSLRDNTNYMEAGVLEALGYAALHRRELLENFWVKGSRALEKGKSEPPYAWIFPPAQRDPARLAYLVEQLRVHRVEVHRLTADLALAGRTFPAGSYVVRMDQPYRNAALAFLEEQKFPADEPNPPYDDVAWTWPLLYGVAGESVADRAVLAAAMEPVTAAAPPAGRVDGDGEIFLLADSGQTSLLAARVLLGRHQVDAAEAAFEAGGAAYPPGSWIVQAPRDAVAAVAAKLGLSFAATAQMPAVRRHVVDLPRLALFHTWTSTQDAGWARYTLDRAGVDYTLVSDEDLRRGGLEERFDVVLFPNTAGDFAGIVRGIDPKWSPLAYTRTPEYPSHGVPDAAEDITGGMGFQGLANLERFVARGGVLVALGNAGTVAVGGGLVRRLQTVAAASYNSPGSELRAKVVRPEHPIVYGYEERTHVFRGNLPLWDVAKRDRGRVVLQFGLKEVEGQGKKTAAPPPGHEIEEKGLALPKPAEAVEAEDVDPQAPPGAPATPPPPAAPAERQKPAAAKDDKEDKRLVLSGYVRGEDVVDGKPAILDLPVGKGRVILFAFNPLHRYLNHADFRLLYNVLLNWNDLPQ